MNFDFSGEDVNKLSLKDKNKLRKKIAKLVEKTTRDDQYASIDDDILEALLFDEIALKEKKISFGNYDKEEYEYVSAKLPVWSGKFLEKIDLSKVDFSNVTWGANNAKKVYYRNAECNSYDPVLVDSIFKNKKGINIDYSNTNAKIDLTKSYEFLRNREVYLRGCNFEGLDLSFNDLNDIKSFEVVNSNLNDTYLKICNKAFLWGENSSLRNVDLSNYTIDGNKNICSYITHYIVGFGSYTDLSNCDLTNTNININFDYGKLQNELEEHKTCLSEKLSVYKRLKYNLKHNWVGCVLNGKMVKEPNDYMEMFDKNKNKSLKKDIMSSVKNEVKNKSK